MQVSSASVFFLVSCVLCGMKMLGVFKFPLEVRQRMHEAEIGGLGVAGA
jgi:hypothetical protein